MDGLALVATLGLVSCSAKVPSQGASEMGRPNLAAAISRAKIDCQSTQADAHGFLITWDGYTLNGNTYKGPAKRGRR